MAEITAQMVKELREKSGAGMMDCKKALTETGGDMEKAMTLLRERGAAIASKRSSRVAKEGVIAAQISPDRKRGALVELNSESDFVARNEEFRKLVQDLANHAITLADPSTMLESRMPSGETVADVVKLLVGKIGENIVLSRWQVLECSDKGYCFSYVHPPGKIGVLVEVETSTPGLADNPEFREFARDIAMHIAATAPTCVRREEVPADMLEKEREIYRHQALNERKPENVVEKIVEGRIQKFFAEVVLIEQPFAKNPDIKVADYVEQHKSRFGADLTVRRFLRWKLGEGAEATDNAQA
jgi:elongation factor Ts